MGLVPRNEETNDPLWPLLPGQNLATVVPDKFRPTFGRQWWAISVSALPHGLFTPRDAVGTFVCANGGLLHFCDLAQSKIGAPADRSCLFSDGSRVPRPIS